MLQSICLLLLLVGMVLFIGRIYRDPSVFVRLVLMITLGFIVGVGVKEVNASTPKKSAVVATATNPILHSISSAVVLTEDDNYNVIGQDTMVGDTVAMKSEGTLSMPRISEIEDDS